MRKNENNDERYGVKKYNGGGKRSDSRRSKHHPGNPPVPKYPLMPGETVNGVQPDDYMFFVGILELHPKGFGYIRSPEDNYARLTSDPFVPKNVIEKYGLREGILIRALVKLNYEGHGPRLIEITDIEGISPDNYPLVKPFEQTAEAVPNFWLHVETGQTPIEPRVVDLLTPMGKGQRGLIIAPPKTGKTFLLQQLCHAFNVNYPDLRLLALLIDEHPNEIIDFKKTTQAEIVTGNVGDFKELVRNTQLIFARAWRLLEMGKDVLLILDSLTSVAWAVDKFRGKPGTAVDSGVFDTLKRYFCTARQNKDGGSLTVVATLLVETGNPVDDLFYEEFCGMANTKFVLDRRLADAGVWPAIDVMRSRSLFENFYLTPIVLKNLALLRSKFRRMSPNEAMVYLTDQLARYETNAEFFRHYSR